MTDRKHDRSCPRLEAGSGTRGQGRGARETAVLVADDDSDIRADLVRELSGDYEVIAVPGVEEALEVLGKRSDFVAVVSDMVMRAPDDGYVLLEAVRLPGAAPQHRPFRASTVLNGRP